MLIYTDLEFTGLHKDTTVISVGCISEDGRTFYGECSDYDKTQVDQWLIDNVINGLEMCKIHTDRGLPESTMIKVEGGNGFNTKSYGTKKDVGKDLKSWLFQFDTVQFVGDVCHYDFVLLIDLISGHALSLPNFISPYCHDINQDIARYYDISDIEAFDINREEIVEVDDNDKHNSLHDAIVCKMIHEKVRDNG